MSEAAAGSDVARLAFEDALKELETIVEKLEAGDIPLEQSIAFYERGVALRRHCESRLKDAQLKIDRIVLDDSGQPAAEPADLD